MKVPSVLTLSTKTLSVHFDTYTSSDGQGNKNHGPLSALIVEDLGGNVGVYSEQEARELAAILIKFADWKRSQK